MIYWAHSDPDGLPPGHAKSRWQRLADHLEGVGALAGELAERARPQDESFRESAQLAGRLHDFGKYSDCFQKMIREKTGRCQHSAHGAAIAEAIGRLGAAFAIAGHHSGIPDLTGGTGTLKARVDSFRDEALALQARAGADLPALVDLFGAPSAVAALRCNEFDLRTRMLFSCLVDADRLDSAGRKPELGELAAAERLAKLLRHIDLLASKAEGSVALARHSVLQDCLGAANLPERLLSLNVPTGGGKTLAAMAFALKRAAAFPEQYRRVIVVIPYLSIIEQNAQVYADIFGADAVFEHHSGSFDRLTVIDRSRDSEHFGPAQDDEEEAYRSTNLRNTAENWDAPLIVTTSVRFFESLFSNRPNDLRRVHNVSRSIIVLDEVQTLPRRLLAPLLSAIRELAQDWGCTFVFSTATQPAFEKPAGASSKDARWTPGTIQPIIQDPAGLHSQLKRVEIAWELDKTVGWPALAERLLREETVLCVVNLREHASLLFDAVRARGGAGETFHLSTRMCAAHRLLAIAEIRHRLKANLPCRVISTQLIEAGVDLDFPVAFRALGPLDSIFQVAGRADREGLLTAKAGAAAGRVIVFRPEDERMPPNEYKEAAAITLSLVKREMLRGRTVQPESMECMETYWNRYYGEGADHGSALQEHRLQSRFATLAREFEMISDRTRDVFVPFDDTARGAIGELRQIGQLTRDLRRRLQRYVVGLRPGEFEKARGVLEEIRKDSEIWVAVDRAYNGEKGLKWNWMS
jgi:CRISPR-associated endonuclease/helicase Cas3